VPSYDVDTTAGPARLDWTGPAGGVPSFVLALTHGAGGTVSTRDLFAARDAALAGGGGVALVTQPYRVRGARAPGHPGRQDQAWIELITWLLSPAGPALAPQLPLIQGGRSNGARVACRTAAAVGARGVLALAFPLQPPARRVRGSDAVTLPPDRSPELRAATAAGAHVLVLNGDRDSFGIPAGDASIEVVVLKGETHSLSKKPGAVASAVAAWLPGVVHLGAGGVAEPAGPVTGVAKRDSMGRSNRL
jgi:uncharacterized protein